MKETRVCAVVLVLLSLVACTDKSSNTPAPPSSVQTLAADGSSGRLTPFSISAPDEKIGHGLHHLYLGVDTGRDGSIYVPASYRPGQPAPLLVFMHGNRGDKTGVLFQWQQEAERTGTILLLPESRLRTWDRIIGKSFGADVLFIDKALKLVFKSLSIDRKHISLAGFSDGASYALSLGQTNGDLFTHIAALSPGDSNPGTRVGRPPVFIMHGIEDDVLPIDECSRAIVPALRSAGYDVTYNEFHGQHLVTDAEKTAFFEWFLAR